jgi:hypothetical protein
VGPTALGRDALEWNTCDWRKAFSVPQNIIFLGENIFGDQYGVDTAAKKLLLMSCVETISAKCGVRIAVSAIERGPG